MNTAVSLNTPKSAPIILWCGRFSSSGGYAAVSKNHLRGLIDVDAHVAAFDVETLGLVGPQTTARVKLRKLGDRVEIEPEDKDDRIVVVFHERPDQYDRIRVSGLARLIGHSVFETESLPPQWIDKIVSMDELWIASEFNRKTFIKAGTPAFMINKLNHSIPTRLYSADMGAMRFSSAQEVVFLTVCSGVVRRDLGLALRAFFRAFSGEDPVRYIIKFINRSGTLEHIESALKHAYLHCGKKNPVPLSNVVLVGEKFSDEEMIRLYRGCDVYVSVERANGWDMPTMEAMACGKLTIGYCTGGSTEYAAPNFSLRLPVLDTYSPILPEGAHEFYTAQWWPAVNENLLTNAMAKALDPALREEMGAKAQTHIMANYDTSHVAKGIVNATSSYKLTDYRSNSRARVIVGKESLWQEAQHNPDMVEDLVSGTILDFVRSPISMAPAFRGFRRNKNLQDSLSSYAPGPVMQAFGQELATPRTKPISKMNYMVRAVVRSYRREQQHKRDQVTPISRGIRDILAAEYRPDRIWTDTDIQIRRLAFGKYPIIRLLENEQARLRSLKNRYHGERCFIIGNGPSLNETDLSKLKDEYTFGLNKIYLLYDRIDWRPTFYTLLDWRIVLDISPCVGRLKDSIKFLPNRFSGIFPADDSTYWYTTRPVLDHIDDQFRIDIVDGVPSKGTITMTAIQIAFFLGFREIYLIGVDASYRIPSTVKQTGPDKFGTGIKLNLESTADDDPNHFDPSYFGKGAKWHDPNVDEMIRQYRNMRKGVEYHGGRIWNATAGGQLEVFDRVDFHHLKSKRFCTGMRTFKPGVTAAIPTCGRIEKLRKCIESVLQDGVIDHVLIWNCASACVDEVRTITEEFPIVQVIESDRVTGPGESRFELANRIRTEFVIFIDDDIYADLGAISELVNLIGRHAEIDILSGAIRNRDGKWLDVSQRLSFGFVDGTKTVHKIYHYPQDLDRLGVHMVVSDIPSQISIMRSAIFQRVNFDPGYYFFFEWFDFGMQCAREGVRVFGTHRATFEHDPSGYTIETNRGKNREIDRQHFMTKWGVRQIGPTGGGYR